jgi:pimeloyl-ACP methyl ester carboxylesterase
MPGLCSNAYAYLFAFPETARAHGGIVAIEGDRLCGAADSGFRSFSWSAKLQRARIEAALAAANVRVPADGLTLIGYSSGASIAELMHAEWPALFPRLVLIAPPKDPSVARLKAAHGVVTMACSLDVTARMKRAAVALERVGVPAIYLEMPGCTHGNIAEGERVFDQAFRWLDEHARPRAVPSDAG